jgi:hypothetical protein
MIKLTETREIIAYLWVHPDRNDSGYFGCCCPVFGLAAS